MLTLGALVPGLPSLFHPAPDQQNRCRRDLKGASMSISCIERRKGRQTAVEVSVEVRHSGGKRERKVAPPTDSHKMFRHLSRNAYASH